MVTIHHVSEGVIYGMYGISYAMDFGFVFGLGGDKINPLVFLKGSGHVVRDIIQWHRYKTLSARGKLNGTGRAKQEKEEKKRKSSRNRGCG